MAEPKREPSQKTQPKGKDEHGQSHPPVEIPVPKRSEFDKLLGKAEKPKRKA